jgi:hypothetical protein
VPEGPPIRDAAPRIRRWPAMLLGSFSALASSLGGRGAGISRKVAASTATAAASSIRSGNFVLGSRALRVFGVGLSDGLPSLVAHGGLRCGGATLRARPIVRPVACVRAFTRRCARERRDGTTTGTITHGDGSSVVRARQCPRPIWIARPAWACFSWCW